MTETGAVVERELPTENPADFSLDFIGAPDRFADVMKRDARRVPLTCGEN